MILLFHTYIIFIIFIFVRLCDASSGTCRVAFASSVTIHGNIDGGLEAADALCRERAAASTISSIFTKSNSFVAYLSNDTHDAFFRLGGVSNDCFTNANDELVASSAAHRAPIWGYNEFLEANANQVWTHTLPSGISSVMNCDSQNGDQEHRGIVGSVGTDFQWDFTAIHFCNTLRSVGCIETPTPPPPASEGYGYPLTAPCDAVAFVSDAEVLGTDLADTAAMDEVCREEARNSVFAYGDEWQQYRAVYSFPGVRTAAEMLSSTVCIGNLLGRPHWKRNTLADPFTLIQTPLFTSTSREATNKIVRIWTGTSPDLNTQMGHCNGWTSGLATTLNVSGQIENKECNLVTERLLCVKAPNDYTGPNVSSLVNGARIMFTTRAKVDGNLGGIFGADTVCQTAAGNSTLPYVSARATRFVVYISSLRMDALARLHDLDSSMIDKPYVNSAGALLFSGYDAISRTAPPNSTLFRDENGLVFFERLKSTVYHQVGTSTAPGGRFSGDACGEGRDWTSTSGIHTYGTNTEWILKGRGQCTNKFHLMCVEVEEVPTTIHYQQVLTLETPSPCLYMFRTSSAPTSPAIGALETLDELCSSLASASVIAGVAANSAHFIGLISNSTHSFRSRLEARLGDVSCWKNTQERLLIPPLGDMFGGFDAFHSGFWADENGQSTSGLYILTGTKLDGSWHQTHSCAEWSTTANVFSSFTYGYYLSADNTGTSCGNSHFFACVQTDFSTQTTASPTQPPTTKTPTDAPTDAPFRLPTRAPTKEPTRSPDTIPTASPTKSPTDSPHLPTSGTADAESSPPVSSILEDTSIMPTSSAQESSVNAIDDASTQEAQSIVPIIAGAVAGLLCLFTCCILLFVVRRRRNTSRLGIERRHRSAQHSRTRSHASRRSMQASRRHSQAYSMKPLHASFKAAANSSTGVCDQYRSVPVAPSHYHRPAPPDRAYEDLPIAPLDNVSVAATASSASSDYAAYCQVPPTGQYDKFSMRPKVASHYQYLNMQ